MEYAVIPAALSRVRSLLACSAAGSVLKLTALISRGSTMRRSTPVVASIAHSALTVSSGPELRKNRTVLLSSTIEKLRGDPKVNRWVLAY